MQQVLSNKAALTKAQVSLCGAQDLTATWYCFINYDIKCYCVEHKQELLLIGMRKEDREADQYVDFGNLTADQAQLFGGCTSDLIILW